MSTACSTFPVVVPSPSFPYLPDPGTRASHSAGARRDGRAKVAVPAGSPAVMDDDDDPVGDQVLYAELVLTLRWSRCAETVAARAARGHEHFLEFRQEVVRRSFARGIPPTGLAWPACCGLFC